MRRKRLIFWSILFVTFVTFVGLSIYGAHRAPPPILGGDGPVTAPRIEFQTISKGCFSGHKSPAYYVIVNEDEWADVWNQYDSIFIPRSPPPEIDFSKTTIIAVFMGEFVTGGYGIEVKEIVDMKQSLVVEVEKTFPGKGCGTTQAFSQPYHIVQINKTDKVITFDTTERIIECP